jgi:hypothetical protein
VYVVTVIKVFVQDSFSFQTILFLGDIGIDDISFTPGCQLQTTMTLPPYMLTTTQSPYCNSTHSHCSINTGQCIPKDQFCNFNEECSDQTDELSCPRTCNFEQQSLCKWTNDTKQKLSWHFGSGKTATSDTGPSIGKFVFSTQNNFFFSRLCSDHTTLSINGTYIYLETSNGIYGDLARLISPLYRKSSKTCMFTFW